MKEECKEGLRVYWGIPPHTGHPSHLSGTYWYYLVNKYGQKLVAECKEEMQEEIKVNGS